MFGGQDIIPALAIFFTGFVACGYTVLFLAYLLARKLGAYD